MSPFDQGETSNEFWVQGVIPLVLGVTGAIVGILYAFGVNCRNKKREVAPTLLIQGNVSSPEDDGRISASEAERNYGPVACQAKLWGLTSQERRTILESIFSRPDRKQQAEPRKKRHNAASDRSETSPVVEDCLERGTLESQHFDNTEHSCLDMRFSCAICLREYEKGDDLLNGTSCDHKFHWECAMIWMTKNKRPKDHCPYCREQMITPEEMKTAAVGVLGKDRVQELMTNEQAENKDIVLGNVPTDSTDESMTGSSTTIIHPQKNQEESSSVDRPNIEINTNGDNPRDEIEV